MFSPIDIEVTNKLLTAVAEEMGIVLQKSAFSPNIKERRDFSCAVFDKDGRLLAQAAHIPVHLGAMPLTVAEILKRFTLGPEDVVITNDPFKGGTHLPDITIMKGVYLRGCDHPSFYLLARAHHADIGGVTPGSMPLATHIDQEGVLIPPSLLIKDGNMNEDFLSALLEKVRNPRERQGDLRAQLACIRRGEERLRAAVYRQGVSAFLDRIDPLLDYGERIICSILNRLPEGDFEFEDFMDDDGLDEQPVPIRVRLSLNGQQAVVDFSNSAPQVKTGINTVRSVTCSAVYYCFFCLVGQEYPINQGTLRPIKVITRPGTILDAAYPAPVAAGNVETSQRIVDCLLGAMSKAMPDRIPAASCGSMNNISVGGCPTGGHSFAYYETIGGGMGGGPGQPGLSGVQVHMTNTLNTPIEALEQEYPLLVERYALRTGSGGQGQYPGGDGIVRRYRFLSQATVTLLTERRRIGPYGLKGGLPGEKGRNLFFPDNREDPEILPGKIHLDVMPGDVLEIQTPGGGGWGQPDVKKFRH